MDLQNGTLRSCCKSMVFRASKEAYFCVSGNRWEKNENE